MPHLDTAAHLLVIFPPACMHGLLSLVCRLLTNLSPQHTHTRSLQVRKHTHTHDHAHTHTHVHTRLGWPDLLDHPFVRETDTERLTREKALADAVELADSSRAWKVRGQHGGSSSGSGSCPCVGFGCISGDTDDLQVTARQMHTLFQVLACSAAAGHGLLHMLSVMKWLSLR